MRARTFVAAAAILAAASLNAGAAVVTFTDNIPAGFFDVFYTVSADAEFTNWDLVVEPAAGQVLDPNTAGRSAQTNMGTVPIDTFANTVFSAVGAGPASHIFTEYNPGSAFPPVPADPAPTPGAVPPAPDALNWSIFDTAPGDGNIAGFTPYHMARVVYTQGPGRGVVTVKFFDTSNAGIGETFSSPYGIPEPASMAMAAMGLIGFIAVRRRK